MAKSVEWSLAAVDAASSWKEHENAVKDAQARWQWVVFAMSVATGRRSVAEAVTCVERTRKSLGDEIVVVPCWAVA